MVDKEEVQLKNRKPNRAGKVSILGTVKVRVQVSRATS